jgi:hypothetical protein
MITFYFFLIIDHFYLSQESVQVNQRGLFVQKEFYVKVIIIKWWYWICTDMSADHEIKYLQY